MKLILFIFDPKFSLKGTYNVKLNIKFENRCNSNLIFISFAIDGGDAQSSCPEIVSYFQWQLKESAQWFYYRNQKYPVGDSRKLINLNTAF